MKPASPNVELMVGVVFSDRDQWMEKVPVPNCRENPTSSGTSSNGIGNGALDLFHLQGSN